MKKLLNSITLLSLLISYSVHSQCTESKKIEFLGGSFGDYTGGLDDNENPSGKGVLKTVNYQQEGNWDSGKLNGKGKMIFFKENLIYEGLFKDGTFIKGTFSQKGEGFEFKYEGDFENTTFQGFGVLEITQTNMKTIKDGEFFNNELFEGKEVVTSNDGLIITSKISRGKSVDEKRNDTNYYNPDDVIGDKEFSVISLKKEGSENEGVSYRVEMEIDGVKGEWIFDTGAELISIGKRMFARLVKEGIKYRDLKRTIKTFGVGGESLGMMVVLDKIKIGDYILNNVKVKVSDNNYSLLGTAFLNKFKNVEWNMKKQQLKLYK